MDMLKIPAPRVIVILWVAKIIQPIWASWDMDLSVSSLYSNNSSIQRLEFETVNSVILLLVHLKIVEVYNTLQGCFE